MTELLLERGARVNVKNRIGDTPLSYTKSKKHTNVIQQLRQHAALLEQPDEP